MILKRGVLIFMSLMSGILFAGCQKNEPELNAEDINAVSYSCSCMDREFSFIFGIREAEDGKVFFDAECFDKDGEYVKFENREVRKEDMDRLRRLISDENTADYLKHHKERHKNIEVRDKPDYNFSVAWKDGTELSADSAGPSAEGAEAFFRELSENSR